MNDGNAVLKFLHFLATKSLILAASDKRNEWLIVKEGLARFKNISFAQMALM